MAKKMSSGSAVFSKAAGIKKKAVETEKGYLLPTVYFTKKITPKSLIKIYEQLGVKLKGKIGVKISTGEMGGNNFLQPKLIGPLVKQLNGTIVECNVAYPGQRDTFEKHWKTIEAHGFKKIAPVEILDECGEMELPVKNGFHLKKNIVGAGLKKYDSLLMLQHFKGHLMAGLGGALKNMSIGLASAAGKINIHTAAQSKKFEDAFTTEQDKFLESMADADESVMDYMGRENMVYINVANRLSIDCDCDSNPHDPTMEDIGIFASLDPVAVDQACVDAVYLSEDPGKVDLIERMQSKHGIRTIEAAAELGLGSRSYRLVEIK